MSLFDITNFVDAFQWVIANGYPLLFVAMFIEGPIVTAAASFAVALGYFNITTIFLLSLSGDLFADVVYYAIGYFGRIKVIEKFGHRFGLTQERMERMEKLLHKNPVKTLLVIKLTPVIATPGLMLVGTAKMPLKKFITLCFLIILPKILFFMGLGYFFGQAYDTILKNIQNGGITLLLVFIAIFGVYFLYNRAGVLLAKKIEIL